MSLYYTCADSAKPIYQKGNLIMNKKDLGEKSCVPCQGGVPRLSIDAANEMLRSINDWHLNQDATQIFKKFTFKNFVEAQGFANLIADLSEKEFHHPDITFGWGYCEVKFQTHKIRGLHENDFIMAAKINDLFK